MLRENIRINDHSFICDLIDNTELNNYPKKDFVMLRNLSFENDTLQYNDIYVIDKDLIHFNADGKYTLSSEIVFPIPAEKQRFSTNIKNFAQLTNPEFYDFYKKNNNGELVKSPLKYDTIRIYHPLTKVHNINFIIYIDTFINNTHFHLFCKRYSDNKIYSETEFKIINDVYSEYISFDIPNIYDLFSKQTFFKENAIKCIVDNASYDELIINTADSETYCSTFCLTIPHITDKNTRKFLTDALNNVEINYSGFPLTITLFPFSTVENEMFIPDDDLVSNSDVFVNSQNFTISTSIEFNSIGKLQAKLNYHYPKSEKFDSHFDAYKYFNNLPKTFDEPVFSYIFELASDEKFKNIIYRSPEVNGKFDNEKMFDINSYTITNTETGEEITEYIFEKWEQLPELLICRIQFLDKYTGIILTSNLSIITKERYKYLVKHDFTDLGIFRLNLNDIQNTENMNFIDKVTCVVKQVSNNDNQNIQINNLQKIIYKPIFYKVQELQNISIQHGVVQNIGINLSNFMTKVETFYLTIENTRYVEIGRNDIFVIFAVPGNNITATGGSYHISNQDDEYISSGQWTSVK